jgi:hypothetical protein
LNDKQIADEAAQIELKAEELVALIRAKGIDDYRSKAIRQKINTALDNASLPKTIEAFKEIDTEQDRLEVLNNFEFLLSHHQLDSHVTKKYITHERIRKGLIIAIGIIMITLGMAMIIMPAPPYFEMFTVFYFNDNDGVTIMDLISLLIVFTGVYLFLSPILKKQTP